MCAIYCLQWVFIEKLLQEVLLMLLYFTIHLMNWVLIVYIVHFKTRCQLNQMEFDKLKASYCFHRGSVFSSDLEKCQDNNVMAHIKY